MIADGILADAQIRERYDILGFVDDDAAKTELLGLPVFHDIDSLRELVRTYTVDTLFIAVPSAPAGFVGRVIDSVGGLAVRLRILPGVRDIIDGEASWRALRDFRPEDLLGREEVAFERERIAPFYDGARVLVTGGGGSIGSEICRELLSLPVACVVAYGHGENSLYQLQSELGGDARLFTQIGDVRDPEKLEKTLSAFRITDVFHAAAHKHVPLMENFPDEAVKNNVYGSYVAARAAARAGARRFLMISTDKAVHPRSVMGATKRVAERVVLGMNGGPTRYAVTRFGNVLGSRGSVLPLFIQQIRGGGPLTITDPEVTRYFMSIREAARLVIKACSLDAGEIYVLDMGRPVNIRQLAQRLILLSGHLPDEIPIVYTGLRPGEKMHEELLRGHENLIAAPFDRLFIASDAGAHIAPPMMQTLIERMDPVLSVPDHEAIRALLFAYAE